MNRRAVGNVLSLAAAAGLVAGFWWQGERFIAANGATFDEAVHLAAGYAYLALGDYRLNYEDPPVLKLWWALPLVLGDRPPFPHEVAAATGHDQWHVGTAFLYGPGVSHTALLTPARRMNLAVGCGVVLLAGWWAFRLWGSRLAGLAASAFAAFDPNLLALSCVLSTDAGLAFFALLTAYLLWEYTAAPSRGLFVAIGVSLGLTLGSKFSSLAVVAGLGAAGLAFVLRGGVLAEPGAAAPAGGWTTRRRLRAASDLGVRLALIGLVVLAATYGFVNAVQLPRGLKFQFTRSEYGDGWMYLCGELARAGWYHYFLVALPLKLPLGLLAAAAAGLLVGRWDRRFLGRDVRVGWSPGFSRVPPHPAEAGTPTPDRRSPWLIVPPLVFFAAASYSRVDIGVRVVLPVLPFVYVLAARLAAPGPRRAVRLAVLAVCVAWAAVASWKAAPYQLAYFNEAAGGPVGGLRYVADSNVDWGQGLPQLKEYTDREGLGAVYLSYFGMDRPEAYGIRYQALPGYARIGPPGGETIPADAPRHVVAVSANNLLGIYLPDPGTFAWLRDRPPTAVLAGCVYVYDLTGDPDAVRRVREISDAWQNRR